MNLTPNQFSVLSRQFSAENKRTKNLVIPSEARNLVLLGIVFDPISC